MLTQDQKDKLTGILELCEDDKLKCILKAAFPKWISGEIEPTQNDHGINAEIGKEFTSNTRKCCLLGTSLIGVKRNDYFFSDEILAEFNIPFIKSIEIVETFDGLHDKNSIVSEIRKVLFGK